MRDSENEKLMRVAYKRGRGVTRALRLLLAIWVTSSAAPLFPQRPSIFNNLMLAPDAASRLPLSLAQTTAGRNLAGGWWGVDCGEFPHATYLYVVISPSEDWKTATLTLVRDQIDDKPPIVEQIKYTGQLLTHPRESFRALGRWQGMDDAHIQIDSRIGAQPDNKHRHDYIQDTAVLLGFEQVSALGWQESQMAFWRPSSFASWPSFIKKLQSEQACKNYPTHRIMSP